MPALPNVGQRGDDIGMLALFCDALKLIRCRDQTVVTTQPLKFNYLFAPQPWPPMCKLLRRKRDENGMER